MIKYCQKNLKTSDATGLGKLTEAEKQQQADELRRKTVEEAVSKGKLMVKEDTNEDPFAANKKKPKAKKP